MEYIKRHISKLLYEYLSFFPVVGILGPRQCGKSTLVKELIKGKDDVLYLDLEKSSDRAKLENPEQFFYYNKTKQVCLDEIQRIPELFPVLRSDVDNNKRPGRFIVLGSASRDPIKQSSETLAGRIGYLELTPFFQLEIENIKSLHEFWFQGGFPDSLLNSQKMSKKWRENFIRTFLERDIPMIGFDIPPQTIGRLWRMLAINQGQLLNLSTLGKSIGVSHTTIKNYIDLLIQTFMIRELKPFEANLNKRLVKTPKVYIRDSGILHSLLNISGFNDLFAHPVFGFSWEGLVIENACTAVGEEWDSFFYRTSHGAELDLVLKQGTKTIAIECKVSDAPKPTKGFWNALEDIEPQITYIVSPKAEKYPIKEDVWVLSLEDLIKELIMQIES
jgi:predicted AAA+ superfamily ATPase